MNKRISKEEIWRKWGTKLKDIDFYKKMIPKNHTVEEWHNYINKNFDDLDYNKKNNLPYSERFIVSRLYRYCNE